jgi:hypothetical protein
MRTVTKGRPAAGRVLLTLLAALAGADGAAAVPAPPPAAAVPKESPALFGMGAQPCKTFVDVASEATQREIALSGAMFSWAQGWFSARNLIGHERAPRVVGGTLAAEKLKSMLIDECRAHEDEALYLAVDQVYENLARRGW